jgi:NAD(P)-dependent dehydrogenase (short-subunit alcohol dehydrogenase family)
MSDKLESTAKHEASVRGFFQRQFRARPIFLPPETSLDGQIAIITGGNGGVGLEAGRQLLHFGLTHLIIGVRSQAKGDGAASKLRQEFPKATVTVFIVDMESYDSIFAFVKACQTLDRIDLVILNAGMQNASFQLSKNTHHEQTLQVNYISTVLLTILLLPVLKVKKPTGSKPPVLSVVSSDTAYWAKVNTAEPIFPQFDQKEKFSSNLYSNTKLLLFWFVKNLCEFIDANDVIVNLTNPGMTGGTSLADLTLNKINPFLRRTIIPIKGAIERKIEDGASVYIYATVVRGKETHGSFISDWTIKP